MRVFEVLTKAETDLRWAQDPRVTLELALLKLAQLRRLMPFVELVERVAGLGVGGAPTAAPSSGERTSAPPSRTEGRSSSAAPSASAAPRPTPQTRHPEAEPKDLSTWQGGATPRPQRPTLA